MNGFNCDPVPTLHTERLILRQLKDQDLQPIFELRSNPKVNEYLGRDRSLSIEDTKEHIRTLQKGFQNNEIALWIMTKPIDDVMIGSVVMFQYQQENNSAEIGFEMKPEFWGNGFTSEAVYKVIEYCKTQIQLDSLRAVVQNGNEASLKIIKKAGFEKHEKLEEDLFEYILHLKNFKYAL